MISKTYLFLVIEANYSNPLRPPSEMFLWRGQNNFKLQFLVILG